MCRQAKTRFSYFRSGDMVYLLTIFGKNEQENVTGEQKAEFKALMKAQAQRKRLPVKTSRIHWKNRGF